MIGPYRPSYEMNLDKNRWGRSLFLTLAITGSLAKLLTPINPVEAEPTGPQREIIYIDTPQECKDPQLSLRE